MEAELSGSSICNNDQDELLKSAKAKMGEVKEENERLKKLLAQIVKQYQSLEKQISTMAHSKDLSSEMNNSSSHDNHREDDNNNKDDNGNQEPDLISLTLGSWSSKNNNSKKHSCEKEHQKASDDDNNSNKRRKLEGGELELGLDDYCKIEHTNPKAINTNELMIKNNPSMEIANQDQSKENIEAWTTTKASRDVKEKENIISGREDDDQDSLHQPQVKKTRVCIRSRCDSPTIHDGCHWRKYGQKIAKGNPCPRAYYRCTVSPTCPVRKQVQRCPHDMSILITTYEGTHNHPLPLSATAMASATSAAAAMIKTNSLTSQTPTLMRPGSLATSSLGLHTSSLMSSFNNNPSLISASSHNSHPTVTLDLTLPNSGFTSFDWLSSSSYNSSTSSRNSSFLNFSSSAASSSLPSLDFSTSSLPTSTSWANGYLLPYNNTLNNNNNNAKSNGNNGGYQNPSMNNNNNNAQQQSLNETIAAVATKAIASNPNFQSVLAAAISSYVGTNNNKANNDQKNNISSLSSSDSQSSEGGRSLTLFPTSTPLSTSKGNSSLAAEARDHSG